MKLNRSTNNNNNSTHSNNGKQEKRLMAGKNKRIIKKKETIFERTAPYRKRSKGLLKKAFELSVLCDIDVALIMYSPTGVLRHFSGNKKLERILQDYIQNLATNPETNEERPVISQDTIDKINILAGEADMVNQQGFEAPERDQEIDKEIIQYQNKLVLLQEKAKKLYPNPGMSSSIQESMERKRYLQEVLYKIKERKAKLLSGFNIRSCTDISQPNTQGQQVQLGAAFSLPQTANGAVQQQLQNVPLVRIGDPSSSWAPPQAGTEAGMWVSSQGGEQAFGMGYPSSSWVPPQAGTEAGMWVPQQGGEQVQLPGVPVFEMGYPSSSSSWDVPLQAGTEVGMWVPPKGGEQVQLPEVPVFEMGYPSSSSSWDVPPQAGTEVGMWVPPKGGEQVQLPEVPVFEMGYPSSSSSWDVPPQAGTEVGMWVPPKGGEQVQLPEVPVFGMGYPSSSWIPPQAGTEVGMWVPPKGGEQVQLPEFPVFGMGYPSSSLSLVPLNTGEQTVNALHSEQIPMQQPQGGTEAGMWVPPMQQDTDYELWDIDRYLKTEWGSHGTEFKF